MSQDETTDAPPSAADMAGKARALQAEAVKQAEQDVRDAERGVRDAAAVSLTAKTTLRTARITLREIKSGPKTAKLKTEPKARRPRNGPASESVAGALSAVPDA